VKRLALSLWISLLVGLLAIPLFTGLGIARLLAAAFQAFALTVDAQVVQLLFAQTFLRTLVFRHNSLLGFNVDEALS
jgi:hypothetical protein